MAEKDAPAAVWSFAGEPAVEMDAGADPFVQVTSATRSGNTVVVGDARANRVSIFSADGKLVRTIGRAGQGPGEFQYVGWVGMTADSILAWDPLLGRLSVFSADGQLRREATVSLAGFLPSIHGRFADGSMLVSVPPLTGKAPVARGRPWRDTVMYVRVAASGQVLDTVGRFPGMEQYESPSPDKRTFRTMSAPFGRWTYATVSGNRFFVATGDAYRVDGYTPDGRPDLVVQRAAAELPVTREEREAYTRLVANAAGARGAEAARELETAPFPRAIPPTGAVLSDSEGRLWVQDARRTADKARGSRWSVFDAGGKWIARAEGPPRFTVHQIGPDWVLGQLYDEDGVGHIRIQRLRRR
ncbi:6-bladed beta-propeller [Longimicrobium terrae]|uniref:6-bladed beta-propeller n=1 Tax=Longimicrobium terrae TaxID=1639882 RepID=A0A841H6F4_9BACT|nr:6-bladed beta-propeller [Longimicrobium terrae]MBB4639274.1 hypothetical protein [Longimicrobium terrae]MBB6073514.1 hypothetical protein [Longimicrobium terrae]NNC32236.1 6-bladed beta-propeller [Longimicrobium terrae]